MANNIAFQPMGKTVQLTANASVINVATMFADSPSNQYLLVNHSNQPVYLWISPSDNPVNVALPTGAGSKSNYALIVPTATHYVVTGPQCSATKSVQISVLSETNGPDVYITPGEGF